MSTNRTATAQTGQSTATAADTTTDTSPATLPTVATDGTGTAGAPEQLSLLATAGIPLQFRLDERTRRSGLAHVAALRAQIAAQAAARGLSPLAKRTAGRPEFGHQHPGRKNSGHQIAA